MPSDLGLSQSQLPGSQFGADGSAGTKVSGWAADRIRPLPLAPLAPPAARVDDGRVIDLAVGSPDLAPPVPVMEALVGALGRADAHGYGSSIGLRELRQAIVDRYESRYGVRLDPDREATLVLGAKEGFAHLLWATVDPGDGVLVPNPSYPVHRAAVVAAGAVPIEYPLDVGVDVAEAIRRCADRSNPRPRAVVISFPHNPTTATATAQMLQRIVDLAIERGMLVIHDFAYADFAADDERPPSVLEARGAKHVAVELYSLSKSYSMAGWRVGFALGSADALAALGRLKPYLDNGAFLPVQLAALTALTALPEHPAALGALYLDRARALAGILTEQGWPVAAPPGGMYLWAPLPPHWTLGAEALVDRLRAEAQVLAVPGLAFGSGGEGHVRFALVAPRERVMEAARRIGAVLAAAR